MATFRTVVITLAAAACIALFTGIIVLTGGFYNVAASKPHTALMEWLLSTAQDRSVRHHAQGEAPDISGYEHVVAGAEHYDDDCMICHAAPGVERSDISRGMNPPPPGLDDVFDDFDKVEVHWIIGHGIKMTGMPSFTGTHGDTELWDIVAFLNRLPGMSAGEYRQLLPEPEIPEPGGMMD